MWFHFADPGSFKSPRLCRLLGYEPNEMVGMQLGCHGPHGLTRAVTQGLCLGLFWGERDEFYNASYVWVIVCINFKSVKLDV